MPIDSVASSSASTPTSITELAQKVAAAVDANRDGSISTDEFVSFLTKFVDASSSGGGALSKLAGAAGQTGSSADAAGWVDPSLWNANNAPDGVTFAGFSPQHHQELSVSDLKDLKNAKYAVYDYLMSNKIAAGPDWAPAAAQALNQFTGSNVFTAIDGETLGYGDEYVHSASNGYGMMPGTYNPAAKSEFFWGYVSEDA